MPNRDFSGYPIFQVESVDPEETDEIASAGFRTSLLCGSRRLGEDGRDGGKHAINKATFYGPELTSLALLRWQQEAGALALHSAGNSRTPGVRVRETVEF